VEADNGRVVRAVIGCSFRGASGGEVTPLMLLSGHCQDHAAHCQTLPVTEFRC
jgi:hypothetical protein